MAFFEELEGVVDSAGLFLFFVSFTGVVFEREDGDWFAFLVGESDWLVFVDGESDWTVFRASVVATLACAATLMEADEEVVGWSFLKKKVPEGKSFVSSLRENAPSLVGSLEGEGSGTEESVLGGEWRLMNERPYFSDWGGGGVEGGGGGWGVTE